MTTNTHTRRSLLAIGAGAVMASTTGCIDRLPFVGDEPLEFDAEPASVPQSVVDETGYEKHERKDVVTERTFETGGQSQDVVVTNRQTEYDKAIDLEALPLLPDERLRAGVCTVLTTPQVDVLGQRFNPVADMGPNELAEMVQERYDGIAGLEQVEEDSVSIAGEPRTVTEYEGEADLVGESVSIDLTLHITEAIESGDDFIVGIGGYPTGLRERERPHVFSMLEAIEHD